MYSHWNKICLSFNGFWQPLPFQYAKWLSIPRPLFCISSLTLKLFSRSQQPFLIWIWTEAQIFHKQVIKLLFAYIGSTNMHGSRSSWPSGRSPKVKMSPIVIHVNLVISSGKSNFKRVHMWPIDRIRHIGDWLLPIIKLGHSDLLF